MKGGLGDLGALCLQVQMVLEWTSGMGVDLMAGKPGPHGLTALHLAAVMVGGASLAALLTGTSSQRICHHQGRTVSTCCAVPVYLPPKHPVWQEFNVLWVSNC
jgi:hypothetical protein